MKLTSVLVLSAILFISSTQATKNITYSSLSDFFKRSEHSGEEWVDVTTGLMMKGPDESSNKLVQRDQAFQRDTSHILVERNPESGSLLLPKNWNEVKGLMRRHLSSYVSAHKKAKHHVSNAMSVVITWYSGHDLLYPSCLSSSDWAPTDDSMVGAVTIAWSDKPPCGQFVKIRHASDTSKTITVRIMDSCGGCASGVPHIDLTKSAFTGLYELDVGSISGLQATMVDAPVDYTWTDDDVAKYGPHKL